MRNITKYVTIGVIAAFFLIAFVLLAEQSNVRAEVVAQSEICNGKDDDADGLIDEDINCDHYISYLLDKNIDSIGVTLKDQFIDPTDFKLTLIERLLNPVKKNHAGLTFRPQRPDLHYIAYQLQNSVSFIPRSVLIENQFEKNTITVTKPRYLLTPAGKRKLGMPIERLLSRPTADKLLAKLIPPIPQDANHYLCYDIEPYDITANVSLKDQFQKKTI